MRLTEEEMQERREAIVQTAIRLFCERGIESVKLSEIAGFSKVSENTIYRYFGNKETLVLEAFIRLWDTIMSGVEKTVEGTKDYALLSGYEQMRVWLEGFRQLFLHDKDFILFSYEAKLYLLRHNVRLDRFQQDTLMHTIREPCLAALDKGKADGSISAELDREDLFYAIWGAIRGYVVKIVIYDGLYGDESPWKRRYETVVRGILCALRSGWNPP